MAHSYKEAELAFGKMMLCWGRLGVLPTFESSRLCPTTCLNIFSPMRHSSQLTVTLTPG